MGTFAKDKSALLSTPPIIEAICGTTCRALSGTALEALVACVEAIGQAGAGKDLMAALLNQGVIHGETGMLSI